MRIARHPLLHFLALGALLHGVIALRPETIEIRDRALAELDAQWRRETGRAPSTSERDAMRRRAADEEMLVREALRLGLDEDDPVVRARLVRNIALITAAPVTDEGQALAHARRLDMGARDVLARRRLVQLMEARLSDSDAPLTKDEVEMHVAANPQRYGTPSRVSFVHVYLGEREGASTAEPAGRAFAAGNRFDAAPRERIVSIFGRGFAESLDRAPVDEWIQETSVFGVHRVRVTARTPAAAGSARDAGQAAVWGALEERERRHLQQGIAELRTHYRVRIGDPA